MPSLTSVRLLDSTCPTQFLNAPTTRLTTLHLAASFRKVQPGTQTSTPAWRATLQHVARCTGLQSLTIPCVTGEELGLVAPALQQLRRLHVSGPAAVVDGDAMVERLLGLPHLTSLTWDNMSKHSFQRSHAGSPCRWRELSLNHASPHQLARLPLHSLTSPVSWQYISVGGRTSVAEVQAAVDNVTRRCPAGGMWSKPKWAWLPSVQFIAPAGGGAFTRGAGEGDTPAALLRALRPLLAAPGLKELGIEGLAWDAALATALGEVLPRTRTRLTLGGGSLTASAAVQLARSLPWLRELELDRMDTQPPHAVTVYVGAATSSPGGACLRAVEVASPVRRQGVDSEAHTAAWEEVQATVQSLGVAFTLHEVKKRALRSRT